MADPSPAAQELVAEPSGTSALSVGGWIALGAVLVGVGALLIGGFLLADDYEMPVPYELEGRSNCWQFGDDLLRCENKAYLVRHQDGWREPSSCRTRSSTVLVCSEPYPLRIEADDSHVQLTRETAESP